MHVTDPILKEIGQRQQNIRKTLVLRFEVPGNKEYLKFLSTLLGSKKIILHLLISRSLLLILTYVFMFGLHLLFIQMLGIEFSPGDWTGILINKNVCRISAALNDVNMYLYSTSFFSPVGDRCHSSHLSSSLQAIPLCWQ